MNLLEALQQRYDTITEAERKRNQETISIFRGVIHAELGLVIKPDEVRINMNGGSMAPDRVLYSGVVWEVHNDSVAWLDPDRRAGGEFRGIKYKHDVAALIKRLSTPQPRR